MNQATFFDRCFRDKNGNIALGAKPNLPIIVAVTCAMLAFVPVAFIRELGIVVAFGSFFVWAWLELFEGINYFRRALGFVSIAFLIVLAMMTRIHGL